MSGVSIQAKAVGHGPDVRQRVRDRADAQGASAPEQREDIAQQQKQQLAGLKQEPVRGDRSSGENRDKGSVATGRCPGGRGHPKGQDQSRGAGGDVSAREGQDARWDETGIRSRGAKLESGEQSPSYQASIIK